MKKIWSCDGGGVRGLLPLYIMLKQYGPDFRPLERYNLFAGTSAGALIAGCFAQGQILSDVIQLFENALPLIFRRNWSFPIFSKTKFSGAGIDRVLKELFGARCLGDLKRGLIVTTYSTRRRKPTYFKDTDDKDILIRDALRASMAAPVYFPWHSFQDPDGVKDTYTDGGVTGNNDPAMIAYNEARTFRQWEGQLILDSYGTGRYWHPGKHGEPWAILAKIFQAVLQPLFSGSSDNIQQALISQARTDMDLIYNRFNPVLPCDIGLDDVTQTDNLRIIAENYSNGF